MELDPERLPRVGGTTAGSYRRLAKDILLALPRSGYVQVEGDARRSLDEMNRIAREVGRRQALVVLVDHVRSQDAGSRRVWQREMDRDLVCCLALVTQSLLGRAIASFFVGLRRPAVPTKLFATVDEAVPWCTQQLEAYDRRALG